jgi:hypothetical protein
VTELTGSLEGGGDSTAVLAMSADSSLEGKGQLLEKGLKFVLLVPDAKDVADNASTSGFSESFAIGKAGKKKPDNATKGGVRGSTGGRGSTEKSTAELSGGQMALLGLSFVFAAALHRRSPLYLLDEVDAALDESNQKTVGAIINKIFDDEGASATTSAGASTTGSSSNTMRGSSRACLGGGSQVLCVSHHVGFQQQARNVITVVMRDGQSIVTSNI